MKTSGAFHVIVHHLVNIQRKSRKRYVSKSPQNPKTPLIHYEQEEYQYGLGGENQ